MQCFILLLFSVGEQYNFGGLEFLHTVVFTPTRQGGEVREGEVPSLTPPSLPLLSPHISPCVGREEARRGSEGGRRRVGWGRSVWEEKRQGGGVREKEGAVGGGGGCGKRRHKEGGEGGRRRAKFPPSFPLLASSLPSHLPRVGGEKVRWGSEGGRRFSPSPLTPSSL